MKKSILLSILVTSLIITSCSKDSPNTVEPEEEGFDAAALEAKLLGTWTLQSVSYDGEPGGMDDCTRQTSITITTDMLNNRKIYDFDDENNECYIEAELDGWFEIHPDEPDEKIISKNTVSSSILVFTYELSATTLKLTSSPENGEIVNTTYVKQ